MSELTDAFEDALDARENAVGEREQVTLQGNSIDALIQQLFDDLQPGAGGMFDGQPVRLSVRKSDVTLPIAQLEDITIRSHELKVLNYSVLEGRIDIVAGDPTSEVVQ